MTKANLPQLSSKLFLTDGGLETTLIFHEGMALPEFASFVLLDTEEGREQLRRYYRRYAEIARRYGMGFILESPTWRASADWGAKLGYGRERLAAVNREAIGLMREMREEFESGETPVVISGCVGPRGDGYVAANLMTAAEAEHYHRPQIDALMGAGADVVSAFTLNYVAEAQGIANAAAAAGAPCVISFTLETDGKLPDGTSLKDAIRAVDENAVKAPVYYMINCAHPTHFRSVLEKGAEWLERIQGLKPNASCRSHAELNESTDLDEGDPEELGRQCGELRATLRNVTILGGCCGTDHRHAEAICRTCMEG